MKNPLLTKFRRAQYNCTEAQRLSIKRQETKLPPAEYVRFKVHMAGCSICREFDKFSALVNKTMHATSLETEKHPPHILNDQEKRSLQQKIDEFRKSIDN